MIAKLIYYCACIVVNRVLLILPLKKKRVLFLSDVRADLSGNFEYVYNEISSIYEIKTSLKEDRRIRRSFLNWLKQCFYLATSQYILLDDYTTSTAYIRLKKGQQLIQLWHSSGAFKKFAHSRGGEDGDVQRIHAGYRKYTKTFASSEFVRPCFANAFSIPVENVFATGIPRTDSFFDEQYKRKTSLEIAAEYPKIKNKKVILLAPTYRGGKVEDANYGFDKLNFDKFVNAFDDDYVILVKWHPALYNNIKFKKVRGYDIEKYKGKVVDISHSREINSFLFITDILITDYSSVIFDYALLNKPIVYFAYDLDSYINERGLYYKFNEYIYGEVASTTESLIEAVRAEKMCDELREDFTRKFIECNDGNATKRVVKNIFSAQ